LRAFDRDPVRHDLALIADSGDGYPLFTTAGNHGFVTGQTVIVRKCKKDPYYNGRWNVIRKSDNTFTLQGARLPNRLLTDTGNVQLFVPIYPAIDGGNFLRVVKRDTGRPLDLSRGRGSNRHARL